MGDRKEKILKGYWEKVMVIRYASVDGVRVRSGNMGMERKRKGRKSGRKISGMDFRSELENTRIYDKGRNAKE